MYITVSREALRAAMSLAVTVADRKSPIPQLACALLRADKTLTVAASDLSTSYVTEIECTTREAGALALDAKGLHDVLSSLSVDEVTIRAVDGKGEIRAGKSRLQIPAQPADQFPKMPDLAELKFLPLDAQALVKCIAGVMGCVSSDKLRTMLAGVHLDLAKSEAMASDGHRGAIYRCPLGGQATKPVLVPGTATLLKAIGDSKEAQVCVRPDALYLRIGATVVGVKLLEAEFPASVIDQSARAKSDHEVTAGREALIASLRLVGLAAPRETGSVRLSCMPQKASLAANGPTGISEDEIAVGYDGKGFECGFNVRYMVDALECLSSEEVTLGFNADKFAPIVVRPLDEEMGQEHVLIVMPQAL